MSRKRNPVKSKRIIGIAFFFILLFGGIVLSLDFTPQGNINMRGIYNITNLVNINMTGNITALRLIGNLSWTNITDYPDACPAANYIEALGDSNTCSIPSSFRNVTLSGNINLTSSDTCIHLPGGGKLCGNASCVSLFSPNGLNITNVCN